MRRYEQFQHYPPGPDSWRWRPRRPAGTPCRRSRRNAKHGASRDGRRDNRSPPHCRRRLPIDRRPPTHQRTRHLHHHQRIDDAAGGAGGDGCSRAEVRAPRRAHRGRRRAPRHTDGRRVGDGLQWMLRRSDAGDRRMRRRREPGPAHPAAEPGRIPERRSRHPHTLPQRLRCRPPLRRGPRRRGLDDGGVRGGARTAHGDDLHPRRAERGQQPAEREGDRANRKSEGCSDSRGCRRRNPDDSERASAERRDPRGLQRRQVPARTADRRPAARAERISSRRRGSTARRTTA